MRNLVLNIVGKSLYEKLKYYRYKLFLEPAVKYKKLVDVKVSEILIKAPENHILVQLQKSQSQPYRDLAIGITAQFVSDKYPGATIIDIGANIGDTAAIIASFSNNPLILVEPSDYYHDILMKNIDSIPNVKRVEKVLISDQPVHKGIISHSSGTARFVNIEEQGDIFTCKKLEEIADNNTKLVKIDTDGFDFTIIKSGLEWLSIAKPLLFYENEIRNLETFEESNNVLRNLAEIGYKYFIVWDDPGFHIVSTSDLDILFSLNRYLFKLWSSGHYRKSICNYDILCVPFSDKDIFETVTNYYKKC